MEKIELFTIGFARRGTWNTYSNDFLQLIGERQVEQHLSKELLHQSCLLCSEETPDRCHRRLAAEYLLDKWGNVDIIHLV